MQLNNFKLFCSLIVTNWKLYKKQKVYGVKKSKQIHSIQRSVELLKIIKIYKEKMSLMTLMTLKAKHSKWQDCSHCKKHCMIGIQTSKLNRMTKWLITFLQTPWTFSLQPWMTHGGGFKMNRTKMFSWKNIF